MARKPFSLTYVTYEEGDSVGLVCALLALAPVFIIVAYATLLVSRRELHVFYILCLLYTSPSPRDRTRSRMPSSA